MMREYVSKPIGLMVEDVVRYKEYVALHLECGKYMVFKSGMTEGEYHILTLEVSLSELAVHLGLCTASEWQSSVDAKDNKHNVTLLLGNLIKNIGTCRILGLGSAHERATLKRLISKYGVEYDLVDMVARDPDLLKLCPEIYGHIGVVS